MAPEPITTENLALLEQRMPGKMEDSGEATPPVSPRSVRSAASLSQRASASMQSMVIGSMVAVHGEPPRLPTEKRKPALSLTTTSVNFRGFVQKSGPMFYFQDNVESTLMWDDWPWTLMWMGIWAVLSLNPRLLLCVPPAVLVVIMCNTYFIRFPLTEIETDASPGDALRASLQGTTVLNEEPRRPPIEPSPVHEGELRYYLNMRDIQNMMRLIIDGYDDIAPIVKYLNWSDVSRTLRLLQGALLATVAMYFVGPLIPLRLTLFLVGELALVANHPWVKPTVAGLKKHLGSSKNAQKRVLRHRRFTQRLTDLLDEDRLPEEVWSRGWRDMELYENQRFRPGLTKGSQEKRWSGTALRLSERRPWTKGSDGWTPPGEDDGHELGKYKLSFALEPGWEWIDGDDWRIDWGGSWSSVGVDESGFVYTDDSWQSPAPYAYVTDPNAPRMPATMVDEADESDEEVDALDIDIVPPKHKAVTRRRRWLRRAVKVTEEK